MGFSFGSPCFYLCIKSVRKDFRNNIEKFSCCCFSWSRQQNTKVQLLLPTQERMAKVARRRQLHTCKLPCLVGVEDLWHCCTQTFWYVVVCHHDAPCGGEVPAALVCGDGAARAEGEVGDGRPATEEYQRSMSSAGGSEVCHVLFGRSG